MGKLTLILLLVSVFGFNDFCYDEICYDNPSREVALKLGGQVVDVDWDAVERLPLKGPGLGIGLDPSAERAYINEQDAGDYICGALFARLLEEHPCSLFVHIPQEPVASDWMVIKKALSKIQVCLQGEKQWRN